MKQSEIKKIAKLVEQIKAHEESAFVELYAQTYQKVYFLAYSVTREQYLAEDVVQEVYIKVLESLDTLRDNEMFMAWLNRITYHASLEAVKKQKDVCLEDTVMDKLLVSGDEEPLDKLIDKEWRDILVDYILELQPELKSVIIMKYYENMRLDEMAISLECPVGTVKSRLYNAKRILRKKLMSKKMKVKGVFLGAALALSLDYYAKSHVIIALAAARVPEVLPILKGGLIGWSSICIVAATYGKVMAVSACLAGFLMTMSYWGGEGSQPEIVSVTGPDAYSNTVIQEEIQVKSRLPIETVEVEGDDGKIPVEYNQGDKSYQVTVGQNGLYHITVKAINQKTAVRQFEVKNIDKENPKLMNWTYDENTRMMTATVQDDRSGIDYNKCYLDAAGVRTKPELWDANRNELRFHLDGGEAILGLFDRSGNYSIYRLTLVENTMVESTEMDLAEMESAAGEE